MEQRRSRGSAAFGLALAISIVAVAAAAMAFLWEARRDLVAAEVVKSQVQVQLLAAHASAVFRETELTLRESLPALRTGLTRDVAETLARRARRLPVAANVVLIDASGSTAFALQPADAASLDSATLIAAHRDAEEDTRIGVAPSRDGARTWLALSFRVRGTDGGYRGVLAALLDPDTIAVSYRDYGTVDVDALALYDANGSVLGAWPPEAFPHAAGSAVSALPLYSAIPSDSPAAYGLRTFENSSALVTTFQLSGYPLRLALAISRERMLAPWVRESRLVGGAVAALALTFIVSAVRVRRGHQRRAAIEADLAASRAREELVGLFRRLALVFGEARVPEELLRRALEEARSTLECSAVFARMEKRFACACGPAETHLQAELDRVFGGVDIAAPADAPRHGRLSDYGATADADRGITLVPAGESGRPQALFGYVTDGVTPARPVADEVLSQASWLIHRAVLASLAEQEQQRLRDRLTEARRHESLGLLAGGVAHDFNNLLAVILGHAEMAAQKDTQSTEIAASLAAIVEASRTAASISDRMLTFAGRGRMARQRLDLSDLLREAEGLLRHGLPPHATLSMSLAARADIEGDPAQLRQVLVNLVTNAGEALGTQGGSIALATGTLECDRALLSTCYYYAPLQEGRYVFLDVRDNGAGIEPATLPRLFDPFFSTKFVGRGLGLPFTLGVIRGHRGTMYVESKPGSGSLFRVLLPEASADAR
jgi:signal transduction histidine kinase